MRILIQAVVLVGIAFLPLRVGRAAGSPGWHPAIIGAREYVPIEEFCRFYGLSASEPALGEIHLSGGAGTVEGKQGSPYVYIDGIRHALSFPLLEKDGRWYVSRTDLSCLFDPVFRPWRVPVRSSFRGVVIDPGHGGHDKGARSRNGRYEKEYALDTARRLGTILRAKGIPVVFTRTSDLFVPLEERVRIAQEHPDYVFVSLHYNQSEPSGHGVETYCLAPRGAPSSNNGIWVRRVDYLPLPGNGNDLLNTLLAHDIHLELVRLRPDDPEMDRGFRRARFVVLRDNPLPGVLVEGGFLSDPVDSAWVDQPGYRQQLAAAVARGLERFFQATNGRTSPSHALRALPAD
ncbi:N-acetylmuramoyl-L-alanine amidase AmiA [Methylacidimicrobium cyclopophantes]|uniref:N-acetylmuramoyl-L-alanine amidase n=1 Tax=Methylacidimicrobium cyclopophantes TaxID=1041766 RepID=A0A5E6M7J9_9BACT|nr:N-acetylmuramoyl-L-alanine amidase [Methylacidimicrobium cyclopophantes]VVM05510.1 N-acetylmuramoyl-L-alanine amidase AmiA [Methylacidimicrobium cyclopophantes]